MVKTHLNGNDFREMLLSALQNLRLHEKEINAINVFPVPDGDTGSNMRLTLENGMKATSPEKHAGRYLNELARGMLFGARGNSGVILSQLFRGFAEELASDSIVDAGELLGALDRGYKTAYRAVTNAREGTLLTVARESACAVSGRFSRRDDIHGLVLAYLSELRKSLDNTPNLLPILREEHVVDSGGFGYFILVEGILMYFEERVPDGTVRGDVPAASERHAVTGGGYGYCTEFVLTLGDAASFDQQEFVRRINGFGDSAVVAGIGGSVKVHVHTKTPGAVLAYAETLGSFGSVKVENMDLQCAARESEKKSLAVVIVSEGRELGALYGQFLPDCIIETDTAMDVSTEQFLSVIDQLGAERYCIILNNGNLELPARQAISLAGNKAGEIICSSDYLEGYYCLACDNPESSDVRFRLRRMRGALDSIFTYEIFRATKNTHLNGCQVTEGFYTSRHKGEICSSRENIADCMTEALQRNPDLEQYATLIIMRGERCPLGADELESAARGAFPFLDVAVINGMQTNRELIIGLVE